MSWSQLVVGAIIGALLTGATQYILNEQRRSHDEQRMRTQVLESYLEQKLQTRRQAYAQIRKTVAAALLNPSPESITAALVSLRGDLPFLQPTRPTQTPIAHTSVELIVLFLEKGGDAQWLPAKSLLTQLEHDMQADISSIEGELLNLKVITQGSAK